MILSLLTIVLMGGTENVDKHFPKNTAKASASTTIIEMIKIDSVSADTIINLN